MCSVNYILTLTALNAAASEALRHRHNADRLRKQEREDRSVQECQEGTPSTVVDDDWDFGCHLDLSFDVLPKDIGRGFILGSNEKLCDVFIGQRTEGVSGHHFSITFIATGNPKISDCSKTGTTISYNKDSGHRRDFTWILFPGHRIRLGLGKGSFEITLRDPVFPPAYMQFVEAHLRQSGDQFGVAALGIHSRITTPGSTRVPSPTRKPLYYRGALLGKGSGGQVHQGYDVSTGEVVALKEYSPSHRDSERESKILQRVSHVCFVVVPFKYVN